MLKNAGVFREASGFAPCKGIQDTGTGLGIPCQWILNSRFLVLNIPDSTRKDFQDS